MRNMPPCNSHSWYRIREREIREGEKDRARKGEREGKDKEDKEC